LACLFIDSTYDITLGILDDELGWIKFQRFFNQKASAIIQKETYQLLQEAKLSMKDMQQVITIAGPGFYTGLRLSEGFADVMTFMEARHLNFMSYEIPSLTGISEGTWMTKAYRGEYFFHRWNSSQKENKLVAAKELESYLAGVDKSSFYIHSQSAIDELSKSFLQQWKTTSELLEKEPKKIFTNILKSSQKLESYYFRAPEDEFKVSL
jgi:tRNA threonylcarbamoyladenosine biosynthesis protein TsaB